MITDFFIANEDEALLVSDYSDLEKFSLLQAKNVESIKLLTLEEILTNEEAEILEPIKEFESGEAWIIPVSKVLTDKLVKLDDLQQTALKWSQTVEWILDNGSYEDLLEFLKSLKNLSISALQEEKKIFVLISL